MKIYKLIKSLLLIPVIFLVISIVFLSSASAEGSEDMIKNGGYRPYLEYSCEGTSSKTAGILRKTVLNVYLKEGETLYLGSSVSDSKLDENDVLQQAATGSDIVLIQPDGTPVSFDVVGNGARNISNIMQEKNGPNIDGTNTAGYQPISFTAPATGVYQLLFHSQTGNNNGMNPSFRKIGETPNQNTFSVAMWDATVVDSEGRIRDGRLF